MKPIISLIAILAALSAIHATELTLMTYNIRLDLASDGPNRWDMRKQQLAAQIENLAPDILSIQEGLPHQVDYLAETLPNYRYTGVGRDDGIRQGEFSAIYYQPAKTELIGSNTFWLSETPDEPSYGWGAHYRRICTYAHFRDRSSGTTYWIFNTHFDHEVPEARLNGAKLILDRIQNLVSPHEAYFLMGDLNATPDSPPIQLLAERMSDSHNSLSHRTIENDGTFNGFDPSALATRRIDYIFTPPDAEVTAYTSPRDSVDQRFPSDHFPVCIKVKLPLKSSL